MKIIVDAFGGDHAPVEILKGCAMAIDELGVEILLTGDEQKIRQTAQKEGIAIDRMQIVHAPSVMPVEAEPTDILKAYADSSLCVGLKLLAEGQGDAFVSAGSTGAVVVGATLLVKRIRGIKRAALGTVIPCQGGAYMLVDLGANAECRPEMLTQFGVMGSIYMERIMSVPTPRVGLVNIGAEETKGTPVQVEAYQQLGRAPINFIGNIEARDVPLGGCDVAVTDGFTGNVVLKLTEGFGKYISNVFKGIFYRNVISKLAGLAVKSGITAFKRQMDYTEYGGAPLLGIAKPVIKAHGSSNAKAFKNAIRQAKQFTERQIIDEIGRALEELKQREAAAEAQQ